VGRIVVKTDIGASITRCFDLARDVDVHCRTSAFTFERVLPPGRTTGLLELNDTITFEGRHFGLRWRLTARIVEMDRPNRFVDESVKGAFRFLRHVHEFREQNGRTQMIDTLEWQAPLGPLGRLADWLLLERHMSWYVNTKQQAMKSLAERGAAAE
jgi:ligand-binding SRPBCC domain-containing protein